MTKNPNCTYFQHIVPLIDHLMQYKRGKYKYYIKFFLDVFIEMEFGDAYGIKTN